MGACCTTSKAMAPEPEAFDRLPRLPGGGRAAAKLVEGASEIKIFGEYVAVKAQVSHLEGFSGHADERTDALAGRLRARAGADLGGARRTRAADALRSRIGDNSAGASPCPSIFRRCRSEPVRRQRRQRRGPAVALGCGLIGLERERRKDRGADRAAAGVRSFSIVALLGAPGAGGGRGGLVPVGALVVGAMAALAYARSRSRDPASPPSWR